ncbi:hypothetical protein EPI10_023754 [Gossypium australe]|uniref:Reverse transcriptase n=1 Tax=Gossypium australe TaxID=47621 RepID=A0A5B6VWK2_9ROSI|nr:hypothetical protein EPI10_023754 [Gossypium australe]
MELTRKLGSLLERDIDDDNLAKLIDTKEQRTRVNWLRLEDKNTTFFHNFASQRKSMNRIGGLQWGMDGE